MAKHIISVCMFCLLCATHSPCESHAEINNGSTQSQLLKVPYNIVGETYIQSDRDSPHEKLKADPSYNDHIANLSVHNRLNTYSNIETNSSYKLKTLHNKRIKRSEEEVVHNISIDTLSLSNNNNNKNDSDRFQDQKYLQKLFKHYGDGKTMTMEGFEKLIRQLDLISQTLSVQGDSTLSLRHLATVVTQGNENLTNHNVTCLNRDELVAAVLSTSDVQNKSSVIDNLALQKACPAILYGMLVGTCTHKEIAHLHLNEPTVQEARTNSIHVWFYSSIAVIVISACGILGLAVIPIMQKHYYQLLLQFLVALAVGTLAGDALLHLLPHAMSTGHSHAHDTNDNNNNIKEHNHGESDSHDENMWKGFVAMLGLTFFFVMERIIIFGAKWRKSRQLEKKKLPKVKIMKSDGVQSNNSSERQCKHKYSSIPYCYGVMIDATLKAEDYHHPVFRLVGGQDSVESHNDTATTTFNDLGSDSDIQSLKKSHSTNYNLEACNKIETNQNMTECPNEVNAITCTEVNKMLASENEKDETASEEYTVILREHENRHHGHSHAHGHVHAAPKDLSSVAWMVIMGDGLHNFTDGMAIGAAFSGSIAGGFSTAVAVFCHELPHELGDFAMLLKAGMSMKQALFYNLLSSVLCLFGNGFGVWLGNTEYASSWVFAAAAGMFIYIALVDMIPELSSGHDDEDGSLFQGFLHLSGLLIGFGIMTCIALYEHDLKHIFREPL